MCDTNTAVIVLQVPNLATKQPVYATVSYITEQNISWQKFFEMIQSAGCKCIMEILLLWSEPCMPNIYFGFGRFLFGSKPFGRTTFWAKLT